jgi:hypothetical protein
MTMKRLTEIESRPHNSYFQNDSYPMQMLDSLVQREKRKEYSSAISEIFKPGGITFAISNVLFLYPIESCRNGYQTVERIDSIVQQKIFLESKYRRLLHGCSGWFEDKTN